MKNYDPLKIPLSELVQDKALLAEALVAYDAKVAAVRQENQKFGALTIGKVNWSGFGSDYLPGGVNGILNHADGKKYDSKSAYLRAVKAKGCQVIGNDLNNSQWKTPLERGVRGDFNVRPELKKAVEKAFR